MRSWLEKALTRTIIKKRRGKKGQVQVPPSTRLVYAVYLSIVMLVCLIALEIGYLVILRTWNADIFAAITGLIGTITGVFLTQKA